jgi:hypothetical protein
MNWELCSTPRYREGESPALVRVRTGDFRRTSVRRGRRDVKEE